MAKYCPSQDYWTKPCYLVDASDIEDAEYEIIKAEERYEDLDAQLGEAIWNERLQFLRGKKVLTPEEEDELGELEAIVDELQFDLKAQAEKIQELRFTLRKLKTSIYW